jgi:HAD superfamily phosphoserine phosphatase-like hydrolase
VVDLARTAVFLDFDGTMTREDVSVHLLERLGTGDWREAEADYLGGRIGSRECLERQWSCLPHDEAALREAAAEVELDADTDRLVAGLQAAGATVTVVSDGYGFYAADVCDRLGVALLTNAVDWETGRLEFPNEDRCCPCSTCGTCKQAPIKEARRQGFTTVLIGDGASDRKAALLADRVFAKGALAVWCEALDVPFTPFESLAEVARALGV